MVNALGGILVHSVRIIYKLACQKCPMQSETPNFHTHVYTYIQEVHFYIFAIYVCMHFYDCKEQDNIKDS